MASHKKVEYVYIIDNVFVNTQSILKILAPKRKVFNVQDIYVEKHYYNF